MINPLIQRQNSIQAYLIISTSIFIRRLIISMFVRLGLELIKSSNKTISGGSFYLKFELFSPKIRAHESLRLRSAWRSEKGGRRPGVWGFLFVFARRPADFFGGDSEQDPSYLWLIWWI
ncbi:MAG: hypothetical protein ABSF56_03365 [Minisyncoccia bacterium]